jgi:hypothetical protein
MLALAPMSVALPPKHAPKASAQASVCSRYEKIQAQKGVKSEFRMLLSCYASMLGAGVLC